MLIIRMLKKWIKIFLKSLFQHCNSYIILVINFRYF